MNYNELNDYELVEKINEDEEVVCILFKKYTPLIRSIAKKLFNDSHSYGLDINDLIQEGMIGFSKAINTYNKHKDTLFFTYSRKCIETSMISAIVKANRKKYSVLNNSISMENKSNENFSESLENFIFDKESDPEAILLDFEGLNILVENLKNEFTTFEEQVFDLRRSGFTYREIAEVLGCEPKKVDNALQRMKNKVKDYIEKHKN